MVSVAQILELVEADVIECGIGQGLLQVKPASPLKADVSSFCYFSPGSVWAKEQLGAVVDKPIGLVISAGQEIDKFPGAINWIVTENPRHLFAKICGSFFSRRNGSGIDEAGELRGVNLENSGVYIDSEIEFIHSFSGSGVKIFPGVKILSGTFIRCGSVLGSDGFGFERRTNDSAPTRMQHYGGLVIGENCDIGSNVSIDRGTFEDTVIGNNVKIDNLVHIAHNVKIGDGTMIVAGSVISGSANIGAGVWVGPNATVSNKIQIGDYAHVSLGSVVLRDVKTGQRVFGNPARPIA